MSILGRRAPAAISIRVHLLLLVFSVLTPVLGFGGFLLWRVANVDRDRLEDRTREMAVELTAGLDREFVNLVTTAQSFARSQALLSGDRRRFYTRIVHDQYDLGAAEIVVRDSSGHQILNSNVPFDMTRPADASSSNSSSNLAKLDALVTETDTAAFSDLFIDPATAVPEFAIVVPVPGARQPASPRFLSISIPAERLQRILETEISLPPGFSASIVDAKGVVVASSPDPKDSVGRPASDSVLNTPGPSGIVTVSSAGGEPSLLAYRWSQIAGWRVGVSIAESTLLAPQRRGVAALALIGATTLAIAGLGAFLTGRRLTRAILALTGTATALRTAKLIPGLMTPLSEVNEVAAALVDAANERARAEAAGKELLEALDLGATIVWDLGGSIRFWSEGCQRLYGWSASEATGQAPHALLDTRAESPMETIEAELLRKVEWSGEVVQRRRDGVDIVTAVRMSLRRGGDGRPVITESMVDITRLRQAENDLRDLNARLEERVTEAIESTEAARARLAETEKLAALGQLAGGIAHDFNNVLQVVQGAAELVESQPENAAQARRLARMIAEASDRGSSIARRLLTFSRRADLLPEPVAAAALLRQTRELLSHTLGPGIEVRVDAPDELPELLADRGQLQTVLINLAVNARDAMTGNGIVTLAAEAVTVAEPDSNAPAMLKPGRYIRLSVADTGAGMSPEVLARASEPFFTTKPPGKGTGLGLAMARGFAEQSGGALAIESAPGCGTTVRIWLSLAEKIAPGPFVAPEQTPAAGKARVLLVDDEVAIRDTLAAQLELAGYAVAAVENASEALELVCSAQPIDLLISDLSMPGMDGLTLIRQVHDRRPGLPAILFTGATEIGDLSEAKASGNVFLLRKPVGGAVLIRRAAEALGRNRVP